MKKLVFGTGFLLKNERKEEKHMTYEKAVAKVIMFNESDVITTSSGDCDKGGWDKGNNCNPNHSGDCTGGFWK